MRLCALDQARSENVWHKSQIVQETGSLFRHLTGLFYRIHYAARREHHVEHWPQQGV